jgi:hypothetical protein
VCGRLYPSNGSPSSARDVEEGGGGGGEEDEDDEDEDVITGEGVGQLLIYRLVPYSNLEGWKVKEKKKR